MEHQVIEINAREKSVIKMPKITKKHYFFIIPALIVVLLLIFNVDWQLVDDERKASSFKPSTEVENIASSLHFTRKGKAIFYASSPSLKNSSNFNQTCGRDGKDTYTSGCYYKDNNNMEHIDVYDVGTSFNSNGLTYDLTIYKKNVFLHEMLHAAWTRLSDYEQNSSCEKLKTITKELSDLNSEINLYSKSQLCTELFSRFGAEYTYLLAEKDNYDIPIKFSELSKNAQQAVVSLDSVYAKYFNVGYVGSLSLEYWQNENKLLKYIAKIENMESSLKSKYQHANNLITGYYIFPTWSGYYSAMNAINDYNANIKTYNSYIQTYNNLMAKLDSEKSLSALNILNI